MLEQRPEQRKAMMNEGKELRKRVVIKGNNYVNDFEQLNTVKNMTHHFLPLCRSPTLLHRGTTLL
jgi:hypothetical protein